VLRQALAQRDKHIAGNGELSAHGQVAVWWLGREIAGMAA
jgi:hypothetical protein